MLVSASALPIARSKSPIQPTYILQPQFLIANLLAVDRKTPMAANPRKRKAELEEELWESHREVIIQLYVNEGRDITYVQSALSADPYNFVRT